VQPADPLELRHGYLLKCRRALLAAMLFFVGCGQHVTGTLRTTDGLEHPLQDGMLVLVEVIAELTPEQTLSRFSAADLRALGITQGDVRVGTAVFVSPYRQRATAFNPAQGLYALVSPKTGPLGLNKTNCSPRGCTYGGDAAAMRVVKRLSANGDLYIVERIIEPANIKGDCYYIPRGRRQALHCKSLEAHGWEWYEDLFVKRVGSVSK